MADLSSILTLAANARQAVATAATAVAEFNEAVAKSASVLSETDLAKLRIELDAVHAESKAMSDELERAIAARLKD